MKFTWTYELKSPPEHLWPFVSDTDRLNREAGSPEVIVSDEPGRPLFRRHVIRKFGFELSALEAPFEWAYPYFYRVTREYQKGPVVWASLRTDFKPNSATGGTTLDFTFEIEPRNALGRFGAPLALKRMKGVLTRMVQRYDRWAELEHKDDLKRSAPVAGSEQRLREAAVKLEAAGFSKDLVGNLLELLRKGPDKELNHIRAYRQAEIWNAPRKRVLEMFLVATRAGIVEMRWHTLCPHCRGTNQDSPRLADIESGGRCESCDLDFKADFERLVELAFRPSPQIRVLEVAEFCTGGPHKTDHIVLQHRIDPGKSETLRVRLDSRTYRCRVQGFPGETVWSPSAADQSQTLECRIEAGGVVILGSPSVGDVEFRVRNDTSEPRYVILELLPWRLDIVTGVDVSLLQMFRDLFASEVLNPGVTMPVGELAFAFTDLKGSTKIYREVGDAPAFSRVLKHFDILKAAIDRENGAIVKTIGDAVMAVFRHPDEALRAMLEAEENLRKSDLGLVLRSGIHFGSALSVNLNERIDYFGSTLNRAARLEGFSTGDDVVLSSEAYSEPSVTAFLKRESQAGRLKTEPTKVKLKGFDGSEFELWRVSRL